LFLGSRTDYDHRRGAFKPCSGKSCSSPVRREALYSEVWTEGGQAATSYDIRHDYERFFPAHCRPSSFPSSGAVRRITRGGVQVGIGSGKVAGHAAFLKPHKQCLKQLRVFASSMCDVTRFPSFPTGVDFTEADIIPLCQICCPFWCLVCFDAPYLCSVIYENCITRTGRRVNTIRIRSIRLLA
jgi:hypothetical protein